MDESFSATDEEILELLDQCLNGTPVEANVSRRWLGQWIHAAEYLEPSLDGRRKHGYVTRRRFDAGA